MTHEYYSFRRHGYIISVRCRHCNKEWDLRFSWSVLFFSLRVILPFFYILMCTLFHIQFPNRIVAIACALLVVIGARYVPAYILCKYMQCTGNYEKFMVKE